MKEELDWGAISAHLYLPAVDRVVSRAEIAELLKLGPKEISDRDLVRVLVYFGAVERLLGRNAFSEFLTLDFGIYGLEVGLRLLLSGVEKDVREQSLRACTITDVNRAQAEAIISGLDLIARSYHPAEIQLHLMHLLGQKAVFKPENSSDGQPL